MADAYVKIKVNVSGERKLGELQRDLTKTGVAAQFADSKFSGLASSTKKLESAVSAGSVQWKRYFGELDKLVVGTGKAITKGLGVAVKMFTVEMGLMSAGIVAMHGVLALGPKIMKLWTGTLNIAAAAAASFAAGMAVAAAAVREQQVAMFAYKGNTYQMKALKSNMAEVRAVMRGMETDSMLASVGMKNLSVAFAEISKNSKGYTASSQSLLKGLMDFASAGQPVEKGIKAAAQLVKVLEDPKGNMSQVKSAVQALGPEATKAFNEAKKAGINTMAELRTAITSGKFSVLGGVQGQFEAVNGTLLSQGKAIFAQLKNSFADIGDTMLPDVKVALGKLGSIFNQLLFKVRGGIQLFGKGNLLTTMLNIAEKLSNVVADLFNKNLQNSDGLIGRIKDKWNSFTDLMGKVADYFRGFVDSAKILEKAFGNVFRPLKQHVSESFGQMNELILRNESSFLDFGTSVGNLLSSISKFGKVMREILVGALPFISKIIDGIRVFADTMTNILETMKSIFGIFGGSFGQFALLMGVRTMGKGLAGYKGGLVPQMVGGGGGKTVSGNEYHYAGIPGKGGAAPPPGAAYAGGAAAAGAAGLASKSGGGLAKATGIPSAAGKPAAATSAALTQRVSASGIQYTRAALAAELKKANITNSADATDYLMKTHGLSKGQAIGVLSTTPMKVEPNAPWKHNYPQRLKNYSAGWQASAMGQKFNRFQSSASGRMGTSMGLGIASNLMPKEAQGAMALGSMVANFNPTLGAAVGLGGAALNARTTAGGIGLGAGGGAAAGFMVAGPAGAAVGALLGAAAGGIMGAINRRKKRDKEIKAAAGNTAKGMMDAVSDGIEESVRKFGSAGLTLKRVQGVLNSSIGGLSLKEWKNRAETVSGESRDNQEAFFKQVFYNQKKLGVNITEEQFSSAMDNPKLFATTLGKELTPQLAAASAVTQKYTQRLEFLKRITGKTEPELLALADVTGVNLYDAAAQTKDMMTQLASGMIHDMQSVQAAAADFGAQWISKLDTAIKKEEAGPAIDEMTQMMRENFKAGIEVSTGDKLKYLSNMMQSLVDFNGGDTFKALEDFKTLFVTGRAFNTPGNQLTGYGMEFLNDPVISKFINEFGTGQDQFRKNAMTELVAGGLANQGFVLSQQGTSAMGTGLTGPTGTSLTGPITPTTTELSISQIGKIAANLTDDQRLQLQKLYADMKIGDYSASQVEERLAQISPDFKNLTLTPLQTAAEKQSAAALDMKNAASQFNTDVINFTNAVEALVNKLDLGGSNPAPDTSKPSGDTTTSRLSQTLAKHNAINSSLTGNRTITSGYRNFALGSINSDHKTGAALDLVGSNLGSYQTAMQNAGGFAEFHGAGPSRHLHTVPNAAIGDTSSPVGGSGGSYNYSIVINGAGMNAQQIANEVANIIDQRHRSMMERK